MVNMKIKYVDEFERLANEAYNKVNMVKKYCEDKDFDKASAQATMIKLLLVTDLNVLIKRIKEES